MEEQVRPSKTQRKQDMQALQALGERLVALNDERLASVELPELLREAVLEARRIRSREGRRRLSTADGLPLTIANALSHDLYYKMINPNASTQKRVTISKMLLLVVALGAATVASQAPADILFLGSAAFSLAAAGFFVPLVAGVFWKRATKWGAISAMVGGIGVTWYYMSVTEPWLRSVFGVTGPVADYLWFGISPISAGIFGLPVAAVLMLVVSLLTPAPDQKTQDSVEHVRYPNLSGDTV